MINFNVIGLSATLITIAALIWSANLAYHGQPITGMFLVIPVLFIRPIAFENGLQVSGWRQWIRKHDPAYFLMFTLNAFFAYGFSPWSILGDQIARTSFGVFSVILLSLMTYIDLYQWKRRDVVPAPSVQST